MTSIQFLLTITPLKVTRKGSDHQLKKLLIVKQILLVSALQNVWRTVWRILMLMIGCKGLKCSRRVNNQKQSLRRILEVISLYKSQNYFSDGFVLSMTEHLQISFKTVLCFKMSSKKPVRNPLFDLLCVFVYFFLFRFLSVF